MIKRKAVRTTLSILAIGVIALGSCKKEDPIEPIEPVDPTPVAYDISGTTWNDIHPNPSYRITALGTSNSYIVATIMSFFEFNYLYNGSSFTTSDQLGSSFGTTTSYGIDNIVHSNGSVYGVGTLGSGNVFTFNGSNTSAPWSIDEAIGTGVNSIVSSGGNKIIGCSVAPFIRTNAGGSFAELGAGFDNDVRALIEFNGDIIAAGDFVNSDATLVNHIARWDGAAWVALDQGLSGNVADLVIYNGQLVALGSFNSSGAGDSNCECVAVWNGTTWSGLDTGLDGFQGATGLVHNSELIVGGSFNGGSSISSPNIIKWNGTQWEALAGGVLDPVAEMAILNNKLYIANNIGAATNFLYRLD